MNESQIVGVHTVVEEESLELELALGLVLGQGGSEHPALTEEPVQSRPPFDGWGLVQVRYCVPGEPQEPEHVPQALQPPSIGDAAGF